MDAPLYPPAQAYEAPVAQAHVMSTRSVSLSELKANPQAWALAVKAFPPLEAITSSQQIKPHLGNFSLRDLAVFVPHFPKAILDPLDGQLTALGPVR